MKLAKWHSYLVLNESRNAPGQSSVAVVSSLEEAIKCWDSRTRISPIYGVSNVSIKSPRAATFSKSSSLVFVGPVSPFTAASCIARLTDRCSAWMTVGAFNFVLHIPTARDLKIVRSWIREVGCRWERWSLRDGILEANPEYSKLALPRLPALDALATFSAPSTLLEFSNAVDEYRALMAAALTRSQGVFPPFTKELESANEIVISQIRTTSDNRASNTTALLTDINAALSRFASQAFSGASPIKETECHFWTHSLLGTGTANIALDNVRSFLLRTLGEARIPDRVRLFSTIQDGIPSLAATPLSDPVWRTPWIDLIPTFDRTKPLFPQITYFSGRDGFKTTETTLSAPLNVITSCSSQRWSLLTVTHEATHTIIGGVLTVILPDFDGDRNELELTVKQLNQEKPCLNLLHELRRFMIRIMLEMDIAAEIQNAPDKITADDVIELVGRWREEVEEIMVHTFDFLYFYGQKIDHYVASIWRSWDTIPHLNSKISEYTVRTLCVAASRHLELHTYGRSRQDVLRALSSISKSLRHNSYVNSALAHRCDVYGHQHRR
jgi:hypothetical protein